MPKTAMPFSHEIAKHVREIYFGGNWTTSSLQQQLTGISWQQATTRIDPFHTIAELVFHTNYYVSAVTSVLEGGKLSAKDELSFDHPPINNRQDWESLLDKCWADGEQFAKLIEQLPDDRLGDPLADAKYGSYYRNLHGIIEHAHYHLGQIVMMNTLLKQRRLPETPI